MRYLPFLVRTGLAAACALLTHGACAVDLVGAYQGAKAHDPAQRAAEHALAAGREKAEQGKALLRPQLGLSASYLRLQGSTGSDAPAPFDQLVRSDGAARTHDVALQLRQPLYDPRAAAEKRQLLQQAGLAEVHHRQASQDLLQRVAETYFALLLAQEHVRVTAAERNAVALQRDRAQARFDVGRGRITDLQDAQARYDAVVTREISARSTLSLRGAQFRELTGLPPEGLAPLRPGFAPTAPQPDDLDAWQQRAIAQNTRVLQKQGEWVIAGAEADKYRLASRPTLDLVASHGWRGQGGSGSPHVTPDSSRSSAVGLQLSLPLYTGGALQSRLRESLARHDQAGEELAAARRDARLQVQDAFLAVQTGVARVASLEQAVRSARTSLEATTLARDLGTRTELDVLDAQQRLFSTQLELAQGQTDALLGRVRLAAAAGDLQESDLHTLNHDLRP